MRSGAEYRIALRDGRKVWVLGDGPVEDVTVHPATQAVVDEYAAWYDRHFDSDWQDIVLTPPDERGDRLPCGYVVPKSAADLTRMGRCFSRTTFLSAGNLTHTPAYGQLIALGVLCAAQEAKVSPKQIGDAAAYRELVAGTGRFLTFSAGAATIGYRMQEDPADRTALKIVRETDAGLVLSGKIGMHTSPAYAEDVYVGAFSGVDIDGKRAAFIVPVAAPGVMVICRKISARRGEPVRSTAQQPLRRARRADVARRRVHSLGTLFLLDQSPEPIARWLFWHQLYCWLSKAEFTLGLALACTHAMALATNEPTIEYLIDLIIDVQTVRSCQIAAELDPEFTSEGYCYPNHRHVAAGSIAMLQARPRMSEILCILPGSSLVVAPSDHDLAAPEMADGLEESFAGGGYTAKQRSALLQMAWDHVSSALDGRESAFELHANGGMPAWRGRLRRSFDRYNELVNGVLEQLDVAMPEIDLDSIRAAPIAPRRPVTPSR